MRAPSRLIGSCLVSLALTCVGGSVRSAVAHETFAKITGVLVDRDFGRSTYDGRHDLCLIQNPGTPGERRVTIFQDRASKELIPYGIKPREKGSDYAGEARVTVQGTIKDQIDHDVMWDAEFVSVEGGPLDGTSDAHLPQEVLRVARQAFLESFRALAATQRPGAFDAGTVLERLSTSENRKLLDVAIERAVIEAMNARK